MTHRDKWRNSPFSASEYFIQIDNDSIFIDDARGMSNRLSRCFYWNLVNRGYGPYAFFIFLVRFELSSSNNCKSTSGLANLWRRDLQTGSTVLRIVRHISSHSLAVPMPNICQMATCCHHHRDWWNRIFIYRFQWQKLLLFPFLLRCRLLDVEQQLLCVCVRSP